MKFGEALAELQAALAIEYGVRDAIVKIALTPEAMDLILMDRMKRKEYTFKARDLGEYFVAGVQVVARSRDTF